MRILLLSPKGPLYRHRGGIWRKSLRYAPLTLTTLAALVPEELAAEVSIVDEGVSDIDTSVDADIVGMTVITGSAPRAYELAREFRGRGCTVVLGGPHVTLMPEEAQQHADAVVVGYAEETWPQLLRDFAASRMARRYSQSTCLRLNNLPMPRRDLLDESKYLTTNTFEATRGCVNNCEFCVVPSAWGRVPYQKPVADVVGEIRRSGARELIFLDLNLAADTAHARSLFEALIPLDIRWLGLVTTNFARDREMVGLAARSGCKGLLLGFESLVDDSLRDAGKGYATAGEYASAVKVLHRHDIFVQGCFVFGLDHDTPDVFRRTARFAVEARIDLPRFAVCTPFPGTPLFARLQSEGRIFTNDLELYDGQHVVFRPERMTPAQLQQGHQWAWRRTYSVASIVRRLGATRFRLHLLAAANLGYRFYANRLHRYHADLPDAKGVGIDSALSTLDAVPTDARTVAT